MLHPGQNICTGGKKERIPVRAGLKLSLTKSHNGKISLSDYRLS